MSSASIELINNTFKDSSNYNVEGKGLYCKCINAKIINNTFNNLSSSRGGALYLSTGESTNSEFIVSNNTFTKNRAQHGGAIYINDAVSL